MDAEHPFFVALFMARALYSLIYCKHMKYYRTFFIGLAACLLLLPVSSVSAMTFGGGEEYVLPENQTIGDDLYVGAANVVINGGVNGDLIVSGGNITVANRVENDLMAAGGNITVSGEVGDDLRAAGGSITILKNVGDDLIVAGGTIHVLKDVVVGGDLVVAGGLVIIDGKVNGNVRITGGDVSINGTVLGKVIIDADEAFKVGAGANVSQVIQYTGMHEADISDEATLRKGVEFTKRERARGSLDAERVKIFGDAFAGILGVAWLIQVFMLLAAALVAVLGLKKFSARLVDASMKDVGKNMLHGFAFLFLTPIALLLLAATVIGIPLAVIGGISYALMVAIAKIYAGILLGAWLFRFASKEHVALNWKMAVVGVLAIEILVLIPVFGWLATFLLFCAVLGVLYTGVLKRIKEAR